MKLNFKIILICLFFLAIGTCYSCDTDNPDEPDKKENQGKHNEDEEDEDDDDSGTHWIKCGMCKGKGICSFCHGDGTFPDDSRECRYCHGSGVCHQCDGKGRVYY